MSIYLQGREAELVGIYHGDEPIDEVWAGDELVWPDVTGSAGGIVIEPPNADSEDYAYWKHAISDIEDGDIDNTRYLKFEVDGVDYYINRAPRGKQRVVLEGNVIKLTSRQQKALAGKLGEYVQAKAEIPARYSAWRTFRHHNSQTEILRARWSESLLAGCYFEMSLYKGQKREWAYAHFKKAVSYPSVTELDIAKNNTATSKGRYKWTAKSKFVETAVPNTDNATEVQFVAYGATGCDKGVAIWFPSFTRTFNLKVIAEF